MSNNRYIKILNGIKDQKENKVNSKRTYEYKCLKCGLIAMFDRNQPSARCPNDGYTMYRID